MSLYEEKINAAQDYEALCNIVEEAADDERITNEDYCCVYAACLVKAHMIKEG